jgi:hypothetical protein
MSITPAEDGPNPGSGTAQGLVDFLHWVSDHHYMNATTASGLRTGVKKVLEVEPDLDAVDIRHADIDDILNRFHNRSRGKMKDRSLEVYESRFRSSIDMYLKWLDKDKDWQPAAGRTRKPTSTATKHDVNEKHTSTDPEGEGDTTPSARSGPGTITYPFPVRAGLQGKITLPEDLTPREAERISAFIKTLAMEDESAHEQSPRAIGGTSSALNRPEGS